METEITIAIIAFLGTVLGSGGGIVASSKLVNHRIKELEKKVNKHNCLIERTYKLEEQMKSTCSRVGRLEEH